MGVQGPFHLQWSSGSQPHCLPQQTKSNLSLQPCARGCRALGQGEIPPAWGVLPQAPNHEEGVSPQCPGPLPHPRPAPCAAPAPTPGQLSCPRSCSLMGGPCSLCLSSQGSLLPPAPPQKASAVSPPFLRGGSHISVTQGHGVAKWNLNSAPPGLSDAEQGGVGEQSCLPTPISGSWTPQALSGNLTGQVHQLSMAAPLPDPSSPTTTPSQPALLSLSCPPFLSRCGLDSIWLLPHLQTTSQGKDAAWAGP